ncbi:MAG: tRNA (N6-isopentenyl adenosine(37)-C2)-methylthiotransferase MiaB [Candidatus Coatesbacteria bacterium]|nr:MAG: tRNA (N6-isopentenyl adenosine(37)-C2)-methylthiotransferase MiaB [Candidatus Coatesbacteria bacterium]
MVPKGPLNVVMETYHLIVYGCQMNVYDGEAVATSLQSVGLRETEKPEDADLIIVYTCTVRASAAERAVGRINALGALTRDAPSKYLAIGGCLPQAEADNLLDACPDVDLVFGTGQLGRVSSFVDLLETGGGPYVLVDETEWEPSVALAARTSPVRANVSIMRGCNNYCSYCIVPYVRGQERSRPTRDIIDEVDELIQSGYKDVTLIGQNVNSYRDGGVSFAELLRKIDALCDGAFLRFTTNHPKDMGENVVGTMADGRNVARHLHLPLQAGSDRILAEMNRGYTASDYVRLVDNIRKAVPGICLTTDVMVGFPTESEREFEKTLTLVKKIGFDGAYTFVYSPREGTAAAERPDDVPPEEKRRRITELIKAQREISLERNEGFVGREVVTLAEKLSRRADDETAGRISENKTVNFPGTYAPGEMLPVKITEASSWTLRGKVIGTTGV